MSVESSISWTDLQAQRLENRAVHHHQELQRVTPRETPLLPTVLNGNTPRGKGISRYKLQY